MEENVKPLNVLTDSESAATSIGLNAKLTEINSEKLPNKPWQNWALMTGFVFIAINAGLFIVSLGERGMPLFFLSHILTIGYIIAGVFARKRETAWFTTRLDFTFIWLVLLQIGAFMFNRDMGMSIYPPSVFWLSAVLTMGSLTLLGFIFRDFLPENVLKGLFFMLGISFVLDVYYFFTSVELLTIGILGIWVMGLSVYAFAPLLKVIYTLVFIFKSLDTTRPYVGRWFLGGVGFALLTVAIFTSFWVNMANKAEKAYNQTDSPLPAWVRVAQVLPPSVLSEKLLKSNLNRSIRGMFTEVDANNDRWHDPLVSISNAVKSLPNLDESERANCLRAIFDARNDAERRLWSGDNLTTETAKTTVQLFPTQRVAYTEMDLSIKNAAQNRSWDREEAIYTFRLPEGGVVTSLTLWVNGEPREGILTTKEKAEQAYNQIVGVQRRDPSVVHWQEGNSVSMRVFPCTPTENRRVKIGFTTPLAKIGDRLRYDNVKLEGTPATDAKTEIEILGQHKNEVTTNLSFSDSDKNTQFKGNFPADWWFDVSCPPLSTAAFEFGDAAYRLVEAPPQYQVFEAMEIWLDVNKAWSHRDFDQIWELVQSKPVFVWLNEQKTQVTESNRAAVFSSLSDLNFTVFPIYKADSNALVISKNKPFAPDFTALKGSKMGDELAEKLPNMSKIRVFCLDNESSTYLNTLQQMRVTQQFGGSIIELRDLLKNKTFPSVIETPTLFQIPQTGMAIEEMNRADNRKSAAAPDHLMRLFAYNKILAAVGKNYFKNEVITEGGISLANRANVVSPLSSLIVLETQADYDRFDIQKSKGSLGNAALNNAGAAPEPHEWVLIVLGLAVMLLVYFRIKI